MKTEYCCTLQNNRSVKPNSKYAKMRFIHLGRKANFLNELRSVVYVAENGIGDPMAMMRSLVKVTSPKSGGCRSWWNSNVICTQDHCKVFFYEKGLSVNKSAFAENNSEF